MLSLKKVLFASIALGLLAGCTTYEGTNVPDTVPDTTTVSTTAPAVVAAPGVVTTAPTATVTTTTSY